MEQFFAFEIQLLLGDRQIETEHLEGVRDRWGDFSPYEEV